MAAWRMQRRLLSLFTSSRQPHVSLRNDASPSFLPSLSSFLVGEGIYKHQFRSLSQTSNPNVKNTLEDEEASSSKSNSTTVIPSEIEKTEVTFTAKSELKISPRHDLAMMFTCKVCETRSVKTISRESYEKGVVVARCGGCNNYHLIADHLGIFGEKGSIEDILAERGEEIRRGNSDTLNLTLEDLNSLRKAVVDWYGAYLLEGGGAKKGMLGRVVGKFGILGMEGNGGRETLGIVGRVGMVGICGCGSWGMVGICGCGNVGMVGICGCGSDGMVGICGCGTVGFVCNKLREA
ncbi:hypothetical protein LXL04_022053 [Taraxacum kok-saghyz]